MWFCIAFVQQLRHPCNIFQFFFVNVGDTLKGFASHLCEAFGIVERVLILLMMQAAEKDPAVAFQ